MAQNFVTLIEKWEEIKLTPKAVSTLLVNGEFISFKVVVFGDATTGYGITNPSGTTFRYTYNAVGTNPAINATTVPVGTLMVISGAGFNALNTGTFVVTGSGANFFEITNAAGVVEGPIVSGAGAVTTTGGVKPAIAAEALLGVGLEDVLSTDADFTSSRKIAYQTALGNYFEMAVTVGAATVAMIGQKYNLATPSTLNVSAVGTQLEITNVISTTLVEVKVVLIA